MKPRSLLTSLVFVLAIGAACAGIFWLFSLRFSSGDFYPEFSSLRSDPMGSMALYEALGHLPGIRAQRSYVPFQEWKGSDTAVLYLGAETWALMSERVASPVMPVKSPTPMAPARKERHLREVFEDAARLGNRVIVSLAPVGRYAFNKAPLAIKEWNLKMESAPGKNGGNLFFSDATGWNVIHIYHGKPVIIERAFGRGSIVLSAAGYPFLNQTLAEHPEAQLLVQILGPYRRVVFDESHFGVAESGSIVGLMRKYRLTGLLAGMVLFAVLLLWKTATPFPLAAQYAGASDRVAGRDSLSGFTSLLRRNIPASQLMQLGWTEWMHTNGRRLAPQDAEHVQFLLEREGDPLRAYSLALTYLLERKKRT